MIFNNIDVDGLEVNAYLRFEGIDIFYPQQPTCPSSGGAIDIASFFGVNFITLKHCKIHGVQTYDSGGGIYFNHKLNPLTPVHDLQVDHCEIFNTTTGIRFSGSKTTIANCTPLAGHVHVGDWATRGGFTGVHQFVKIGAHVMCGVSSVVLMDIPPYITAGGNPLSAVGINAEGLKRRDFSAEQITTIKRAYKTLYRSGLTFAEAKKQLAAEAMAAPELKILADFLEASARGIVR